MKTVFLIRRMNGAFQTEPVFLHPAVPAITGYYFQ